MKLPVVEGSFLVVSVAVSAVVLSYLMGYYIHTGYLLKAVVKTVMIGNYIHRVIIANIRF